MRNFGFTFGRTREGQEKDLQELEKRLAEQERQQPQPNPHTQNPEQPIQEGRINNGWIYVPSNGLEYATERSHQDLNWTNTHKQLIPKGLRMPTITETWELIFYLQTNLTDPKHKEIYNDILKTTQIRWHGEWQNDFFTHENGKVYIQHIKGLKSNGELEFTPKKEITGYIKQDTFADISSRANISNEGLCKSPLKTQTYQQGENIYFFHPRNKAVARFVADSCWAVLDCNWGPTYSNSSLGVRAVREAPHLKK